MTINNALKSGKIPSICIDYKREMAKVIRHLIQFKHTNIAFLNGGDGTYSSEAKYKGVELSLRNSGYPLKDELHVIGLSTVEGGFEAMNILLNLPRESRPTAVISSNDLMALGAIHAIRSSGLSIPGDISVIGFDDISIAAHSNPPLTTISPPKFELGSKAVQMLVGFQELQSTVTTEYRMMDSPLIFRESTGPCPE